MRRILALVSLCYFCAPSCIFGLISLVTPCRRPGVASRCWVRINPRIRGKTGGSAFIPCSNVLNWFDVLKTCYKWIQSASRNVKFRRSERPLIATVTLDRNSLLLWRQRWRYYRHDKMTCSFGARGRQKITQVKYLIHIVCSNVDCRGKD